MRSLHPLAATPEVEADLAKALAASEANRAPNGVGWTAIHLIQSPSLTYAGIGLALIDAAAVLAPIMPRIKRFYATASAGFREGARDPLGSYEEEAWCFGRGSHCYVKVEPKGDLVDTIWFDISSSDRTDLAALRAALEAIDRCAPSMIADYYTDTSVPIGNRELMDDYFTHLTT